MVHSEYQKQKFIQILIARNNMEFNIIRFLTPEMKSSIVCPLRQLRSDYSPITRLTIKFEFLLGASLYALLVIWFHLYMVYSVTVLSQESNLSMWTLKACLAKMYSEVYTMVDINSICNALKYLFVLNNYIPYSPPNIIMLTS